MAPTKKHGAREIQYYDTGVQGRKTGITLADTGVYDEQGHEPISGIFSSAERFPPKRGNHATRSGSTEIQGSSMPGLTTSCQILRNNRTVLPPSQLRSAKKTSFENSPRRQSSMAPKGNSFLPSSHTRDSAQPIARRLDLEQNAPSLQKTSVLSGLGTRRTKRLDVPEEGSPASLESAIFEESMVQGKTTASKLGIASQESFVSQIGGDEGMADDQVIGDLEQLDREEEPELVPEPPKEKAKKNRKRKGDVVEDSEGQEQAATEKPRKRSRPAAAQASESQKSRKNAPVERRRSQHVCKISDDPVDRSEQAEKALVALNRRGQPPKVQLVSEQGNCTLEAPVDNSIDQSEQLKETPAQKKLGRPAKAQPNGDKATSLASASASAKPKEKPNAEFAKPAKPMGRPKVKPTSLQLNSHAVLKSKTPQAEAGKLVDVYRNPLSKKDIDQSSATTAGSRFGQGRHLSVFREMYPNNIACAGQTGRHRVAPIDFWKNDHISYDPDGSMTSTVKNQAVEQARMFDKEVQLQEQKERAYRCQRRRD